MKRLITLALSMLFVTLALSACAEPQTDFPDTTAKTEISDPKTEQTTEEINADSPNPNQDSDFSVQDNKNGTCTVWYIGTSEHVVVPSQIKGLTVTAIGEEGFFMAKEIVKTVYLPNTVITIGRKAFENCILLEEAYLPDSLTKIGSCAFAYCTSLKQIRIPGNCLSSSSYQAFMGAGLENIELADGVEMLPDQIFAQTNITEINIPGSIKEIGWQTFAACKNLETILLNEGIETIQPNAFDGCPIQEITIPASAKNVQETMFANCTKLESVYFVGDAPLNYLYDDSMFPFFGLEDVNYTIYYHEGVKGFTSPKWNGFNTNTW